MCAGLCMLGKAGGVGVCTKYKVIQNYRLQKYKSYKKFQNTGYRRFELFVHACKMTQDLRRSYRKFSSSKCTHTYIYILHKHDIHVYSKEGSRINLKSIKVNVSLRSGQPLPRFESLENF